MSHFQKAFFGYFLRGLTGFGVSVVGYFMVLILWWQFFPYQTADIAEPMIVLNENKTIKRGEELMLEFTFTKYTDVSPEVSRNISCLDDSVHFPITQPIVGSARPVGTFTARPTYELPVSVPADTLCFFQFTNVYEVNPIRNIVKVWRSESFIIEEQYETTN